jgi:uncharacterized protein YqeY
MKLQERIQSDLKQAMLDKNENKKSLLRVFIGEMNRIGKDVSDEDILKILRKMKENAEMMKNNMEVSIINEYLPVTISYDQTKNIISDIISKNNFSGMKDMGKIIVELKKLPIINSIDLKMASQISKEILS